MGVAVTLHRLRHPKGIDMRLPTALLGPTFVVLTALAFTGCASGAGDPAGTSEASPPPAASPSTTASPEQGASVSTAAQRYIDAVNSGDLEALVDSFTADAAIVDVSRRVTGADAIRTWADSEVIGGTLRVDDVADIDPATQRIRVHWAPAGSDGWAADYTFTTDGDRITLADLQYAE